MKNFLICLTLVLLVTSVFAGDEDLSSFKIAMNAYRDQFYETANEKFEEFILLHPDSQYAEKAAFYSADSLFKMRKFKKAKTAFEKFCIDYISSKYVESAKFRIGQSYFSSKQYKDSIISFNSFIENYSNSKNLPAAQFYLAESYFRQDNFSDAKPLYIKIISDYSESIYSELSYLSLGWVFTYEKDYKQARKYLEEYIKKYPKGKLRYKIIVKLADIDYKEKRFLDVVKSLKDFPLDKFSELGLFLLGDSYYYTGDYKKAKEYLGILVKAPNDYRFEGLWSISWVTFKLGEYDAAENYLLKLKSSGAKGPWDNELGFLLADVYFKNSKVKSAEEILLNLMTPANDKEIIERAIIKLGKIYIDSQRSGLAVRLWNEKAKGSADKNFRLKLFGLIGDMYYNSEDYQRALEHYKKIASENLEEINCEIRFKLALCLMNTGSPQLAINNLEINLGGNNCLNEPETVKESMFWLGELYYQLGNYMNAAKYFSQLIKEFPNDSRVDKARYGIAWSYFAMKDFKEAGKLFKEISETSTNPKLKENSFIQYGLTFYELGDYKNTIITFQKFIKSYPKSRRVSEADFLIGKTLYKSLDFKAAEEHFKQNLTKNYAKEEKAKNQYWIALCYIAKDDYSGAIDELKKVTAFHEGKFTVLAKYKIGDCLYNLKRFEEAIKSYQWVISSNSTDDELRAKSEYNIEWCNYRLGKYKKAIFVSKEFLRKYPESSLAPEIQFKLGMHYFNLSNFKNAQIEFKKTIDKYDNSDLTAQANYFIGICYYKQNQIKKAQAHLDEVYINHRESEWGQKSKIMIGKIHYENKNYLMAIEDFKEFLNKYPTSFLRAEVYYNLGLAYRDSKKFDEGIDIFNKLVKQVDSEELRNQARLQLGTLYQLKGENKKALEQYQIVVIKGDGEIVAEANYWIGDMYFREGEYKKSIDEFFKIVYLLYRYKKWVIPAELRIAEAYDRLGKFKDSKKMYEKIIKDAPDDETRKFAEKKLKSVEKKITNWE